MNLLFQFTYLQALDVLSTMAFLLNGVQEANPIVRLALKTGASPLVSLVALKVVAVAMAVYCVRRARHRLLSRINVFFAALVAWNLIVVVVSS